MKAHYTQARGRTSGSSPVVCPKLQTTGEAPRGHNLAARGEAAVRRWEPATPAGALLAQARAGMQHAFGGYERVRGPHLRRARTRQANNRTGVPGISLVQSTRDGRILSVACGRARIQIRVESIGMNEAWRRALKVRAAHERRCLAANALILAARQRRKAEELKN